MATKNITTKLSTIQVNLKAPKGQFNSFGKYNYRNCEDILEALKPLLKEVQASLVINDEVVLVGDRYYVKAQVTLLDNESDEFHSVTAYAREEESKKGMDSSQLTGSTSSYARKYALNGLFAIDDTKDSDATNTHDNGQEQATVSTKAPTTKPTAPVKDKKEDEDKKAIVDNSLASDAQVTYMDKLIKTKNYTNDAMTKYIENAYKKKDLKALTKQEASEVINMLNAMD